MYRRSPSSDKDPIPSHQPPARAGEVRYAVRVAVSHLDRRSSVPFEGQVIPYEYMRDQYGSGGWKVRDPSKGTPLSAVQRHPQAPYVYQVATATMPATGEGWTLAPSCGCLWTADRRR